MYLAGDFAADFLITACMFVLVRVSIPPNWCIEVKDTTQLFRARAETIWTRTQTLYDRLIIVTVSTGLLTALTALISLALFLRWPNQNTWYIACVHPITPPHLANVSI